MAKREEAPMFSNKRFITRTVNEQVGLDLQIILWSLIDNQKLAGERLDYLQIFECKAIRLPGGRKLQQVIHRQEVPPYSRSRMFSVSKPVNGKLYAIDDGDHSTLMFASEY